jgi:succinate-semialdehyde dehydrogenase / glutarate-semialdehyde dehydrogenase
MGRRSRSEIDLCSKSSTNASIGHVPNMGTAETQQAIDQANEALPAWRAKAAKERSAILRKWFYLMLAGQDDLACHHDGRAK